MAATGKVIGTVTAVVGEAKATAADGTARILQVGDQVRSDEAISTSAAGSINVALESGKTLDCGGDVSLTLHESILGVATAASASTGAPASDVDAIQRAIAAGQDPSQVAAATAAGGAPAAGGADDGGAHEPVILEQSNTASVVTSGFTTEGDTLAFPAQEVSSLPGQIVASVPASVGSSAETGTPSVPAAAGIDNGLAAQVNTVADDQPIAPVNAVEPAPAPVATIEIAPDQPAETNNAPQVVVAGPVDAPETLASDPEEIAESPQPPVVAEEPVIVATGPEVNEEVAESPQPPVVADEPVIVATTPEVDEEVAESPQPPVVAEEPVIVATAPEVNEEVAESPQPPVVADEPVIVATAPEADEEVAESPQPPVVADEPVIVATTPEVDEEVAESPQPPVVAEEPVIVATTPEVNEEVAESPQPPVVADEPVIVATTPEVDEEVAESPQPPVVAEEPVIVASTPEADEEVAESPQPPVVAEEPVIVASTPEADEEVAESPQPPVVVTQPEDETVVVTEPEDDTVVVTEPEDTSDLPDSPSSSSALLTYSISANTNQDEQLALLTFENGINAFQSLVFFHQQGQQKPLAVALEFDLDYGVDSTIKLQYIDAFAGDSDSSTGHTAQKIAIKDFALGEGDTNTLIAEESDGVNVGLVGQTMQSEGTVVVQMNDPSTTADDATAGPIEDWSYTNPVDVNDRVTYDANPAISQDGEGGFDILDVTSSSLDLTALDDAKLENFEVIALKGSGAQSLTLSVEDVLKVTDGMDVLHIIGGTEDRLNVVDGQDWTVVDGDSSVAGFQPSYFGWVQVTHSTGATLLVDPDVNVHLLG